MHKAKVQFKEPQDDIFVEDLEDNFKRPKIKDNYESDESVQDSDESEKDIFESKYLNSSDIQGQESNNRNKLEEAEEFEQFNMNQELEEGNFTKDGIYVKTQDGQAIHDNWLKGITEEDMLNAKVAHDKSEMVAEVMLESVEVRWKSVLRIIKPGETILTAIRRLGVKRIPKWKKVKIQDNLLSAELVEINAREFDLLTSLASSLLMQDPNTYERRFEDIISKYST